jgi:hypothetical protein
MDLQIGPEIILSYKRLAYQAWYALAEFVDNSTQAYFNNQATLDAVYKKTNTNLTVEITTGEDAKGSFIRIADNSIGMSEKELKAAVVIGRPPAYTGGRSKYGLGLKTGACWFGDWWSIKTKKLGDNFTHTIKVVVPRVARNHLTLPHAKRQAAAEDHFTVIEIRNLHREIAGQTVGKVKNYLRSLYRVDIREGRLILKWNGQILTWDLDVDKRILRRIDNTIAKKEFQFKIGRKKVSGWAGVLARGSRREAGFSIIQADRVITGWPDSFRPSTLYGSQEGGSNDLVNQRLFGELCLDGFEVSHTKDQILFDDADQQRLEHELGRRLSALRQLALSYRKNEDGRVTPPSDSKRAAVLNRFEREIKLDAIQSFLQTYEVPRPSLIKKSNDALRRSIVKKYEPDLKAKINKLLVSLYLVKDMSPNDPYVLIESTELETSVIVIINGAHPHWAQLTGAQSMMNFIRHCTYDGVAEWKAFFGAHTIEPDTVKLIKDNLLRIPMTIRNTRSKDVNM